MRARFFNMSGDVCTFAMGNHPAAQFPANTVVNWANQGKDPKAELLTTLSQIAQRAGVDMGGQNAIDLNAVVDKYVDIILNAQKG